MSVYPSNAVSLNRSAAPPRGVVVPTADETPWVAVCTDPKTVDTSANLLQPSGLNRVGNVAAKMNHGGTTVRACLRYQVGQAVTTAPVIQLIGIDQNGVPTALADANGNTSWTLSASTGSDKQDANNNAYTSPVEVDVKNNSYVQIGIVTALVGGGTTGTLPAIMLQQM